MTVVVDHQEPLFRGTEDHRLPAAPAVRIGVRELRRGHEPATLAQPRDDVVVHLEHAPTHERLRAGGETTGLVHRVHDAEVLAHTDREVLLAVAWCGVNEPGAFAEAHVRRAVDDARFVAPRRLEDSADEFATRETFPDLVTGPARHLGDAWNARLRDHVDASARGNRRVRRRRIDHQSEIRGQGPWRGGPRESRDLAEPRKHAARVLLEWERDQNRRRWIVLVLDLRFGECRAIGRTPVDRAQPTLDVTLAGERSERLDDLGLESAIHRQIGMIPLAPDAKPFELVALDVDPL